MRRCRCRFFITHPRDTPVLHAKRSPTVTLSILQNTVEAPLSPTCVYFCCSGRARRSTSFYRRPRNGEPPLPVAPKRSQRAAESRA